MAAFGALLGYLPLLGATLLLEVLLVALLAPRAARRRFVAVCLCLNLVTHPLATLLTVWIAAYWCGIELMVAAVEAVGYRAIAPASWPRATALAAVANAVTAAVGMLLAF